MNDFSLWKRTIGLFIFLCGLLLPAAGRSEDAPQSSGLPDVAGNDQVQRYIEGFKGRGAVGDFSTKPLAPAEALGAFTVSDDLAIDLVAAEPEVRQPVCIWFDERGRMWVVQYLQYPFPAGLKVVRYDEHLRAVFDKVPAPPPNHVRGADKITIHEDTNGDGRFDKTKTFVDGLNIATSVVRGRGGVWVLNPPYLLFYPDADRDDVPDGPPTVHLEGFGLEDTHAVANSLCWGPDGWLYGAQGSTVHAYIKRPGIDRQPTHFKGQAIWRYHAETKRFEVFAEGGGNTFGVEFDAKGRVYSGHNGGDTRGFHFVQGGYYQKNWGKHGELTNPYAFGFFPQMKHERVERFSHTFVVYEGDTLPERYRGKLLAPVPLHRYVALSEIRPDGSTFQTRDLEKAVTTSDTWFRPVDIKAGPDGGVYLADWYDTRLTHVDPRDTWDRSNGRIYRLWAKDAGPRASEDLGKLSSEKLVALLGHNNKWHRQTALRLLGDRKDRSVLPLLHKQLAGDDARLALESLWAIHIVGGLDEKTTLAALGHRDPHVRRWAARLVGDEHQASPAVAERLVQLAGEEGDVEVRSQLASTAKRLPGPTCLAIVGQLLTHTADAGDPHLPLLCWWAVESKATSDRQRVLAMFNTSSAWANPTAAGTILPRLARRWATDSTRENLLALARLIDGAPDSKRRAVLLGAVNESFAGRRLGKMPPELSRALLRDVGEGNDSPAQLALRVRAGDKSAQQAVLRYIANDDPQVKSQRIAYIELLGQVGPPQAVATLVDVVRTSQWHSVRRAALEALSRFDDEGLGSKLIAAYDKLPTEQGVRPTAIDVLSRRKGWSAALLAAVAAGKIARTDVPVEVIERIKLHGDASLDAQVHKLWGRTRATPDEKQQQMQRLAGLVADAEHPGDLVRGRAAFVKTCAKCHKLHGEGADIGPDLTGYERDNLDFLLLSTVDPSAAIREEFTTFRVLTVDGLVLTGFIKERGSRTITLQTADQGQLVLPIEDLEEGPTAVPTSLMPDKLLDPLGDQQLRDLFAYLRAKQGPAKGSEAGGR